MGRKSLAAADSVGPDFVDATPADMAQQEIIARQAVNGHEAAIRLLASRIGYQLPGDGIDPDLIQRDIAANMRRSVEACLEVGRGLRVLKEACEHGQFSARLDVLGIDKHVASRFMQSAVKFSKLPSTATLRAIGNQTKLFEMLVLDDEQIEELELTGTTGELSLDDIASMSVKELRTALREARQQAESTDRILAEKNRKIDDLARAGDRGPAVPPWDERFAGLNDEIASIGSVTDECLGKQLLFIEAAEALAQQSPAGGLGAAKSSVRRIGEQIERICNLAAQLRFEYETRLAGYIAQDLTHILPADETV